KTFNANPAPAVICRLSDYRYVKVNVGFLEMTGYARDQVIGRSVYELDVLDQAERRELAVERLGAGETIPQMEASLRVAEGGRKCVVVAGQPIEVGEEACMLFTFTDLEPRKKAEEALRKSEERFAKAFRMAPVPSLVLYGDDLQALDINQAFSETFGYQAEELLGESTVACGLWQDGGAERLGELLAQSGSVRNVQLRLQHKDRNGLDCLVSAEAVSLNEQDCVLVALLDISDRRRTEMELAHAIETVMQDASWFSRTLIEKLANVRRANAPGTGAELADLTAREREVFDLICQGLADKEIAKELGLAPNTVRNHVATIYAKLDVHSRGEAIVWARERGFAPEPRNGNGRK
ncbi:helix-turn-helix transcriptional regulator, partial [Pseudomonas aeruginosa]